MTPTRRPRRIHGNFSFTAPSGWKADRKLGLQLGVNLALVRNRPRHYAGLKYHDYKSRTPSDAELFDEALKVLRGEVTRKPVFAAFEYEDPFKGKEKGRTGTLDGESALVMTFQAHDFDEVMLRGEVTMLTRHGFGYWIFTWGPEEYFDQISGDWETLREHFKFANQREGWKPRPREAEPFTSPDLGYQLSYAKELWRVEENPRDYDDKAVLALKGFEPSEDGSGKKRTVEHAGKLATVQVLHLPEAESAEAAAAAALAHVEAKQKQTYPMLKVEPLTDSKTGKPLVGVEVGALRGQVSRYKLLLDADTERYLVLAVAALPKGTLAIVGECRFPRRDFWEQEFRLTETVRRPKAK